MLQDADRSRVPFYIFHQKIIVLTGWWLLRFSLHSLIEFGAIFAITVAGWSLFYDIGRRINWLRPVIWLRRETKFAPTANTVPPLRR